MFLEGYNAALEAGDSTALAASLEEYDAEARGFAYEGAAMALALLDWLTPWRRDRIASFLAGAGNPHAYMVHVGIGWVWARMRLRVERRLEPLDPLLRWLALDGYGFHEGYFHFPKYVDLQVQPERLRGYALRAFDQGLGRSLWFAEGADVERIPVTIAGFPEQRWADLWSGVGLACAYAGGVEKDAIIALHEAAGSFRPHLAQGAAFAAQARRRAGNPAPHTELACEILCAMPADAAAQITNEALAELSAETSEPRYEAWRRGIRERFMELVTA
jgi:hypothetical protein